MEKLERLHIFGSFCTWDGVRALCERKKLKQLLVDSATPPPGSEFQWHYLNDQEIEREILGRRQATP